MIGNPFHDLYLSEAIPEETLVELFSPIIVDYASAMFEPGNVIIRGLQGTGKTMLLNLLRPESRLAFRQSGTARFPVPESAPRFIGAGINLRKCGALEFVQQISEDIEPAALRELELLFADFVNHLIVLDLISTVERFRQSGEGSLLREVGINAGVKKLDEFASLLARDPCWFDAMDGVTSLEALQWSVSDRLKNYRRYLNLNLNELPPSITETKTIIGDPILKTAEALRVSGVLDADVKVYIRIDQYEQLPTLNIMGTSYGTRCQELIHKALSARDGRVSYRIGTRTHGWPERPVIYRTTDVLELKRDFNVIDIDEVFRRRENVRTWAFPDFARDIFSRRLKVAARSARIPKGEYSIAGVLGASLPPRERADKYVSTPAGRSAIIEAAFKSLGEGLPSTWRQYVRSLAPRDLLSAWLACAWIRQKSFTKKNSPPLGEPPFDPIKGEAIGFPWDTKPYWYKERVQIGLLQLASQNRQKLMWSGEDDVLSLSGGQILVFLFLLQHIWDAWLRDKRNLPDNDFCFPIEHEVQSQGIFEASIEWRSKQIEGPIASQRRTFVDALGKHFYLQMTNDQAMSYPGANGISIENSDLERPTTVNDFLMHATGFGDLYGSAHTSKRKGERRTKYYLAPILSPYYRIPSVHTKEPLYVGTRDVLQWLKPEGKVDTESSPPAQATLWSDVT